MIESPLVVVELDGGSSDDFANPLGQVRGAGCGIANIEQSLGETGEIMDRSRAGHIRDPGPFRHPMGRDAKNRLWPRESFAPRLKRPREVICFDRVHR